MSEELKKKLYHYEADPSGTVWDKIAVVLDEENASITQRLYHAEVVPPAETWNAIAGELDGALESQYSLRLHDLEVVPPAGSWEKIEGTLGKEPTAPEVHSRKGIVRFLKFAAAACVMAALAFGAFKFLNRKLENRVAEVTIVPKKDSVKATPGNSMDQSSQVQALSNNLPKETIASTKSPGTSRRKQPRQLAFYATPVLDAAVDDSRSATPASFQQAVLRGSIPGDCALISDADRYLMFVNPDGYLVRISKKLGEALGCVYTNANAADYKGCEDQITKWREKIAQSPVRASTDNFMDVLDIIKAQDN